MIPRYTREEMGRLWTDEAKFSTWLEVEIAICEGWNKLGVIPDDDLKAIQEKARVDVDRINELEKITRHDVIAFVSAVGETVGPPARFIHLGVTSSDILDTALAVMLNRASALILEDLDAIMAVLKRRAYEFKDVPQMGRSHGIHAEPTTFGLKMALWFDEMQRNLQRFERVAASAARGMISGAVGTYAFIDPQVQEIVCEKLGIASTPISTQVIQRDVHADFMNALALIGATIEKIAVEIRHLQRTEVLEAEEPFTKGQKGSSAMPHKRNPIASENLTGVARLLRANAMAALENVALWHERDISHSSVERVILPDSTILVDYALSRLTRVLQNLVVYPDNMKKNLWLTHGLIFSQAVLLALAESGMTREQAYSLVQENAMHCWQSGESFKEAIKSDEKITRVLTDEKIEACFDEQHMIRQVDYIYDKLGLK